MLHVGSGESESVLLKPLPCVASNHQHSMDVLWQGPRQWNVFSECRCIYMRLACVLWCQALRIS